MPKNMAIGQRALKKEMEVIRVILADRFIIITFIGIILLGVDNFGCQHVLVRRNVANRKSHLEGPAFDLVDTQKVIPLRKAVNNACIRKVKADIFGITSTN